MAKELERKEEKDYKVINKNKRGPTKAPIFYVV